MTETWAYQATNVIEISGDLTAKYWPNQLIKITQGTEKFFVIMAVSLVGGNTRLTVSGGGVYTLTSAAITSHRMTMNAAPAGLPSGFVTRSHIRNSVNGNITTDGYSANPSIDLRRANGTIDNPTAVLIDNYLASLGGYGYYGSAFCSSARGRITIFAAENWTETAQGVYISFQTTALNSIVRIERMRIMTGVNIGGTFDPGANNLYVMDNCSASSFTDRTPAFSGDALEAIRRIKADESGLIDHATLPEFARHQRNVPVFGFIDVEAEDGHVFSEWKEIATEIQDERNIGNMLSIHTTAIQQLIQELEKRDAQIADLSARLEKLEGSSSQITLQQKIGA